MKTTEFVFFGGKGGVGKTTCAAAHALAIAQVRRGQTLVVSTDPAHSLGDALGMRLSPRPTPVSGVARLDAAELDAPRAFERWTRDHGHALGDVIEHGTYLDRADIAALLELPMPGVDELVGLLEIVRMARRGYDTVVIDTAPTGHALRLLASPAAVAAVARVLDALQSEHRLIRERFGAAGRVEAADRLIRLLGEQAAETSALLREPRRTSYHWVLLPEALSVAESAAALAELSGIGIHVDHLVINRVIPPGPPCPICDRRRADQRPIVARAARTLGARRKLSIVHALPREPRGVRLLRLLKRDKYRRPRPARKPSAAAISAPASTAARDAAVQALSGGARLVFVGGKGGVGKTTVAAALALQLAKRAAAARVLLLSTDPAHSLGDVLRATVSDVPAAIASGPPNLLVRELDAPAALAARRDDLEGAIDEILTAFGAAAAGRGGVAELMELAPPGIDELFGLISVAELFDETYDTVIVDTAPTGHALRLLELPDAARDWVQVLLRVLLKYRDLVKPGQLAGELVKLSRQVRSLQALLRDASHSRFVVVTRAAALPQFETGRLLRRLRSLEVSAPAVFVNALTLAPGTCPVCRATAAAEKRALTRPPGFGRRAIIQGPLMAPPPRGVRALEQWAATWIR